MIFSHPNISGKGETQAFLCISVLSPFREWCRSRRSDRSTKKSTNQTIVSGCRADFWDKFLAEIWGKLHCHGHICRPDTASRSCPSYSAVWSQWWLYPSQDHILVEASRRNSSASGYKHNRGSHIPMPAQCSPHRHHLSWLRNDFCWETFVKTAKFDHPEDYQILTQYPQSRPECLEHKFGDRREIV